MKQAWLNHCLELSKRPADLYCGSRKIIRNIQLVFPFHHDMKMADAGYAPAKFKQLERNYLHQESIDAAISLWDEYRAKPKYRSVVMSCFKTLVKDHKGPRGSKMGSCLLAVTITMLNRRQCAINLHYRTTEIFKKFAADLVFLHERLLPGFNFEGLEVTEVRGIFDNVTLHPQYFTTIIPHLDDPIGEFEKIKLADPYFYGWCIKWVSRMLIESQSRGIAKFAQGMRVKMDAEKRISTSVKRRLIPYLKKNHPGFTRTSYQEAQDWVEDDDDE